MEDSKQGSQARSKRAAARHATVILAALLGWPAASARAETRWTEAAFTREGAVWQGTFPESPDGTITLTVPPGALPAGEILRLDQMDVSRGDTATTQVAYDPGTTLTFAWSSASFAPGPHYLVARAPLARRMTWTWVNRKPDGPSPLPGGTVTSATLASRYRNFVLDRLDAFWDPDTTGTWRADDPDTDFHWMREDIYYAWALFERGDPASVARANQIIRTFCSAQDRSTTSLDYGLFYTNAADRQVPDGSSTAFCAPILGWWLLHPPAGVETATLDAIREALPPALDWFRWRFLTIGYTPLHTNFQALAAAALAMGGQALNDPGAIADADDVMTLWYDHFIPRGASNEFNSPVYTGVTLWALAMLAGDAADPAVRGRARVLQHRMWLDTAMQWHPAWSQSAGPYSRAYEDGLRGATGLTGFCASLETGLDGYNSPGRIAENMDARHTLDTNPAPILARFSGGMPGELRAVFTGRTLPAASWQTAPLMTMTSYLSPNFTLGTGNRNQAATCEGFLVQARDAGFPGGFGTLFARGRPLPDGTAGYDDTLMAGIHALQDGARALCVTDSTLAAATTPGKRAGLVLVADERYGQWQDIRIGGSAVALPAEIGTSDTLFARRGPVFLALQPAYAVASGPRMRAGIVNRGDGHLNVALHAVDTTVPVALAGKRIEAAFALTVAEGADWPSYDAFVADHLAFSTVTVSSTPATHTVVWDLHGSMAFDFDRTARTFASRSIRGAAPPADLALSEFAVQSTGTLLHLRDLDIAGVAANSWLVYPPQSPSALVVNPAATTATVSTSWTSATLDLAPYEIRRLLRPPPAGVAGWPAY